jgi:hypothetical protein
MQDSGSRPVFWSSIHGRCVHLTIDPWDIYESLAEVAYSDIQLGGIGENFNSDVGSGRTREHVGTKCQVLALVYVVTARRFRVLVYFLVRGPRGD